MSDNSVQQIFDTVKLIGTANSSGLFAAGAALVAVRMDQPPAAFFGELKCIAVVYFIGVFCFALSYGAFASQYIARASGTTSPERFSKGRYIVGFASSGIGFGCWLFASATVLFAICRM
jgi:hypothetical protein